MTDTDQKKTHITEIKCVRTLDGLISGTFMAAVFMFFSPMLMSLPVTLIRYLYLIPILFVFIIIFTIPKHLHKTEKWYDALGRLRLFAFISLGLAPFWFWWHSSMNNPYLMINVCIFIFAQVMTLYNMMALVSAAAEDDGYTWFLLFTRFSRLVLIYLLIAPLLALFITICLGFIKEIDIFILLFNLKSWDIIIFGVPLGLTLYALWQWRLILVRHLTGKKD